MVEDCAAVREVCVWGSVGVWEGSGEEGSRALVAGY